MEFMNSLIVGASLTEWTGNILTSARTLIVTALGIIGLVVAILIIAKNPTMGRVITGILVGAFIAALPWILPAVGEMFRGDIAASGMYSVIENQTQAFLAIEPNSSQSILL